MLFYSAPWRAPDERHRTAPFYVACNIWFDPSTGRFVVHKSRGGCAMRGKIFIACVFSFLGGVGTASLAWGDTLTLATPGAGSVTIPAGYDWTNVTVQCWGGGGGGGGGANPSGGGGGGGGAYSGTTCTAPLFAGAYSYYVGAGGDGGSGSTGSGGGSTIWNYGGVQDIVAGGGGGGACSPGVAANPGAGGGTVGAGTGFSGGRAGTAATTSATTATARAAAAAVPAAQAGRAARAGMRQATRPAAGVPATALAATAGLAVVTAAASLAAEGAAVATTEVSPSPVMVARAPTARSLSPTRRCTAATSPGPAVGVASGARRRPTSAQTGVGRATARRGSIRVSPTVRRWEAPSHRARLL
jgi:hypothetical protein